MAICGSCGEENPERARFCLQCGAALAETEAPERFRKTVTILFSDVVGSTSLGERLDPETLSRVMTEYFDAVRPVAERHGGTVAKFIGDAVMVVFGIPEVHEDDALRAVRAALEMRETLARVNQRLEARYGVGLSTRTGIATGPVAGKGLVPDRNFVAGDTANIAARLQSAAGPNEILLGDRTYSLVRDAVEAEILPPLEAKGKSAPLTAHRLVSALGESEALARRLESTLVGRANELEELEWEFRRCVEERRCRMVTIVAPAGVGKSRLAREIARRLKGEGTVLEGHCLPYGEGITYFPLAQMVKLAAGIGEDDQPEQALAKLRSLAPTEIVAERVAGLIGLGERGGAAEEGPWAVRRLLETVATARPLLCVFDNLQWAEETLLDLLTYVAEWSEDAPILLLCLARPELSERRPDWPRVIELRPLSPAERDRLLDTLLVDTQLSRRARDRMTHASGGNPLFLEQLVAKLVDEGMLDRDLAAAADIAIPPTIQALLAARLERLEPRERAVLSRAAVAGETFYRGALHELAPESMRSGIDSLLLALVRKELIVPARSDMGGEEAFRFRHLLIRDAAYEALTKEDRAGLHEAFADWVQGAVGERTDEYEEILGYHLEQSHRYRTELGPIDEHGRLLAVRAADRLGSAGRRAGRSADPGAAAALLGRALALVAEGDRQRPALQADLGRALTELGRYDEAAEMLDEAFAGADDARTQTLVELDRIQLNFHTSPTFELGPAQAEARRVARLFETLDDFAGAAAALRLLAWIEWLRCRAESAYEAAEQALAAARKAGEPPGPEMRLLLGGISLGPTPTSAAIARVEEILATVRGRPAAEASARESLARLRAMRGEFDLARELAQHAVAGFEELGSRVRASTARAELLGWYAEALRGDWQLAERELRAGYDALQTMGAAAHTSTYAGWLAYCLQALGRDDEAVELADVSERTSVEDDVLSQVVWRIVRAKVLAGRGELEDAEALAREALALVLETDIVDLQAEVALDLAEILRAAGRADEARAAAEDAVERSTSKEYLVGRAKGQALLERLEVSAGAAP